MAKKRKAKRAKKATFGQAFTQYDPRKERTWIDERLKKDRKDVKKGITYLAKKKNKR